MKTDVDQAAVFIFGIRRARISDMQRRFRIDYNTARKLIADLEATELIEPMNDEGWRPINWHNPTWLSIAKRPELWVQHAVTALQGEYSCREEQGLWLYIHEVYGNERIVARFDSEKAADDYQARNCID